MNSDDVLIAFVGFCLGVVLTLVFMSARLAVDASLIGHAEHLCRHNDGVAEIRPGGHVTCQNGAMFSRVAE